MSGEPFDHSSDGRERCGILRVHARVLDDIDCEAAPNSNIHMRFICEREQNVHKEQQKSQNFIWSKLERLLEYFGFTNTSSPDPKPEKHANASEDYIDEVKKLKISSKEKEELKNIKIDHDNSSEEQQAVESALKILNKVNKPGESVVSTIPDAEEEETSRPGSQEDRPNSSTELLSGPTTSSIQAKGTSAEATSQPEATEAGRTTIVEVGTVTAEASASVVEETTVTTEASTVTTEPVSAETTTTERAEASTVNIPQEIPRAWAAPLKEISEADEGSGTEVERTEIEAHDESSNIPREIDPEKLEKVISTMEKMIENLEKLQVVEPKKEETKKEEKKEKEAEIKEKEKIKQVKKDGGKEKEGLKKKGKAKESLVRINEKVKEDAETVTAMEGDFDEATNKNLPSTDIKPPEEECDEEASGEIARTLTSNEEVMRNAIDTEDVDDLTEKEAHIQDFLTTLRTFLSRAEHSDLRKLLDEHPEKTLLEKMKLAIKAANEREFERMKELELMKKHGVDISHDIWNVSLEEHLTVFGVSKI
ncbi:unnamed protein product [Strongylus vulgaris]|uniref:Uncharacterized protein n=1 Tax=Strongylus vulgaris TaxID=40348 RepID=A0A3P7LRB1_STRVU|nr:unnamed protein product [Strongylus vulgaris]